jgi:hypothetical protein
MVCQGVSTSSPWRHCLAWGHCPFLCIFQTRSPQASFACFTTLQPSCRSTTRETTLKSALTPLLLCNDSYYLGDWTRSLTLHSMSSTMWHQPPCPAQAPFLSLFPRSCALHLIPGSQSVLLLEHPPIPVVIPPNTQSETPLPLPNTPSPTLQRPSLPSICIH